MICRQRMIKDYCWSAWTTVCLPIVQMIPVRRVIDGVAALPTLRLHSCSKCVRDIIVAVRRGFSKLKTYTLIQILFRCKIVEISKEIFNFLITFLFIVLEKICIYNYLLEKKKRRKRWKSKRKTFKNLLFFTFNFIFAFKNRFPYFFLNYFICINYACINFY